MKKYETVLHCYYDFVELNDKLNVPQETDVRMTTLIKRTEKELQAYELLASSEQKQNPFFGVLASEYPLESLAIYTNQQANLNSNEIKKLIQLNRLLKKLIAKYNWIPKAIVGFIIAAGVLLLKEIPKEVFDYYNLNYTIYQVIVLWITIGSLLLFLFIVWLGYVKLKKARQDFDNLEKILTLCSIYAEPSNKDSTLNSCA